MPMYSYSAKNIRGEIISGTEEFDSLEALKKSIYEKNYFLTEANIIGKQFSLKGFMNRISNKEFVVFCRQLSVLLNSGVTVVESINVLVDQTQNNKFKEVLKDIHEQILKGKMFSSALKNYKEIFPEFFINMVKVGEESGSLDIVLNRLADYYERENKVRKKVKSAMTYPIIVLIVAIGVITLLMVKVLPMFAEMLSSMGGDLPFLTRALMAVSNFMVHNILLILFINIISIAALVFYFRTEGGRYNLDVMKLKLPLIKNLTIKVITSKFARSMGLLLKSGIPIISAIEIMGDLIGNRAVEYEFKGCCVEMREGKSISKSIKNMDIFPNMLIHMTAVGESTGELDEMLIKTAVFFDEEVEETIDQLTTMIEPIMIISLAFVVAVILLAIMLPMVNIMKSIN